MTVIWIILILFAALLLVVPMIERWGPKLDDQQLSKLSRWFLPLIFLMLLLSLIGWLFR